jgi:hypothetical protein
MNKGEDDRASEVIREQERMKGCRGVWDSHWQEIAERIWPDRALFQGDRTGGEKRTERVFESTPALALTRFAAAMEAMLTPRTQRWHRLSVPDPELQENSEVQRYLDAVTDVLFRARYAPKANFASQQHEAYLSNGAFGTGVIFVDEIIGESLRYRAIPLSEIFIAEDFSGIINRVHRRFQLSNRQAVDMFGKESLPDAIVNKSEGPQADEKTDFIHCVYENKERKGGDRSWKGMPWRSVYVSVDCRATVDEGGYRTMPYSIGRYITTPGEVYGRSPAMLVLPDIKMLNEQEKTIMRAAQRVVEPPLLVSEDGALQPFNVRPNALNYGYLNDRGEALVQPLQMNGNIPLGIELQDQKRKVIQDAFLVTLFQILVDQPNMTATEAMLRAQEKGQLLAPTMGRWQSEQLGPMIERELDILGNAGMLPPMPKAMMDRGGQVEISYESPLNRAQRAEEGMAILNTLSAAGSIAQFDPSVVKLFKGQDAMRELADINGMPAKLLYSPEEMEQINADDAQQQQLQQLLAAAPVAGQAAESFAQANVLANQAGPSVISQ